MIYLLFLSLISRCLAKVSDYSGEELPAVRPALKCGFPGLQNFYFESGSRQLQATVSEQMIVQFDYARDHTFYTVLLVDPDFPDPDDPRFADFLHWMVVDIPAPHRNVDGGQYLAYYVPAIPPIGTHRYYLLLLEQEKEYGHYETGTGAKIEMVPAKYGNFNTTALMEKWNLRLVDECFFTVSATEDKDEL